MNLAPRSPGNSAEHLSSLPAAEREACRAVSVEPAPTLIFRPRSYFERLDLAALFCKPQPLEVELGSGDGSFLARYAALHPEINFIGVERLLGRLRKLDRKGLRAQLANLRAIRIEASYFVEFMLPAGSTRAIHLYFPDPWPKRRHHRRRLVNARFVQSTRQALAPRGVIYLRTDNPEYYQQMLEVFQASAEFERIETPESLSGLITDFEKDFHAKGIPTLPAAFRLREGLPGASLPAGNAEGSTRLQDIDNEIPGGHRGEAKPGR